MHGRRPTEQHAQYSFIHHYTHDCVNWKAPKPSMHGENNAARCRNIDNLITPNEIIPARVLSPSGITLIRKKWHTICMIWLCLPAYSAQLPARTNFWVKRPYVAATQKRIHACEIALKYRPAKTFITVWQLHVSTVHVLRSVYCADISSVLLN